MSIQSTAGRAFTCQECFLSFSPARGGLCPSCGRILCDDHFFGSFLRRMTRTAKICVACRTGIPPASPDTAKEGR